MLGPAPLQKYSSVIGQVKLPTASHKENGVRPEYGFIEALDLALRHLAQSPGIKSYGECIPVMAGEFLQGHHPEW
jgi:hypothetical protein